MNEIKNLVFAGSALQGFAYIGVLQELEEQHKIKNIKYFAGTSSGAFISTMAALGLSSTEIIKILKTIDLSSLVRTNIFKKIYNFIRYYGLHSRSKMSKQLEHIFTRHGYSPDLTFGQLFKKTGNFLCITVCDLHSNIPLYINPWNSPNVSIITILTASLSIPGVFTFDKTLQLVDGGLVDNFPFWIFNNLDDLKTDNFTALRLQEISSETLGVCFENPKVNNSIRSIYEYVQNIFKTTIYQLRIIRWNLNANIITLPININTNFNLDVKTMNQLIQLGKEQTKQFIEFSYKKMKVI